MTNFTSLLDHIAWADALALDSIVGIDPSRPERAEATRLFAHVAAAEHVWASRLEGREPVHPVWPALSLEEAGALASQSVATLRRIVTEDPSLLDRVTVYRNSAGQEFTQPAFDLLMQLSLHGSYHRGQLALLARQAGATPAATDYIVFTRGAAVPATARESR